MKWGMTKKHCWTWNTALLQLLNHTVDFVMQETQWLIKKSSQLYSTRWGSVHRWSISKGKQNCKSKAVADLNMLRSERWENARHRSNKMNWQHENETHDYTVYGLNPKVQTSPPLQTTGLSGHIRREAVSAEGCSKITFHPVHMGPSGLSADFTDIITHNWLQYRCYITVCQLLTKTQI